MLWELGKGVDFCKKLNFDKFVNNRVWKSSPNIILCIFLYYYIIIFGQHIMLSKGYCQNHHSKFGETLII